MASLLDGLLGQQRTPTFSNPGPNEVLNQIYGQAPRMAAETINYNQALLPGLARVQRGVEDVYDPFRGRIRDLAGNLIYQQLNMGGQLPPDASAAIRQSGFERGAITGTASGRGVSNAGQAAVARDLGLTSLDLLNQRIGLGASYGNNTTGMLEPQSLGITPADAGNVYMGQQAQQNNWERYKTELNAQNARNLIQMPLNYIGQIGQIAGSIAGAVMGTNMGGMGGMMGGMGGGAGATGGLGMAGAGAAGGPSMQTMSFAAPYRSLYG